MPEHSEVLVLHILPYLVTGVKLMNASTHDVHGVTLCLLPGLEKMVMQSRRYRNETQQKNYKIKRDLGRTVESHPLVYI